MHVCSLHDHLNVCLVLHNSRTHNQFPFHANSCLPHRKYIHCRNWLNTSLSRCHPCFMQRIGAIATCYMALNILIASPFFLLQPHLWDFVALCFRITYEIVNEEHRFYTLCGYYHSFIPDKIGLIASLSHWLGVIIWIVSVILTLKRIVVQWFIKLCTLIIYV